MGFIGKGLLEGMVVTARNFVGSYFDKERLITVQYPEERSRCPKLAHFPFLVYDETRTRRHDALHRLQDLRDRVSAAMHLHRHGPRREGQAAAAPEGVRHRHQRLHAVPDLRRGLPVRRDQDGQRLREVAVRAL